MIIAATFLTGCSKEQPPTSVNEFLDKPILLEAAMVRCSLDRSGTRYEAECVNAREAVSRISVKEEATRKAEMDARSQAKRRALRRTQRAAAEARRRVAEAARLREEADYLAQFGVLPDNEAGGEMREQVGATSVPTAVVPEQDVVGQSIAGDAPTSTEAPVDESNTDLDAIRKELNRRNEN